MVDGLFFCATLTGCRVGHTPFVQAGAETPDTGAESRFEALCICTRWMGKRRVEQMSRLHGTVS